MDKQKPKCQFKRRGGWCARYYSEEYHITPKGLEKRLVSQRCKDVTNCKFNQQQ